DPCSCREKAAPSMPTGARDQCWLRSRGRRTASGELTMKEFRVTLTQRAGELARLTALLAEHGINLKSVAGVSDGHKAMVCLVVEDVAAMRDALAKARMPFVEEEILSELLENEPGKIADLTSKLANSGVSLHSLYILAREGPLVEIGFTVDDPRRAKKALAG